MSKKLVHERSVWNECNGHDYKIIDEKCLKQSAVARAAGYDPKKFNALLRGRKRLTSDDVVPICKALGVTPNELFGIDHPATPEKSA